MTPQLPFEVADYVDFYSSLEHATNAAGCSGRTRSHCAQLALAARRLPRPRRDGRRQRHARRPAAREAKRPGADAPVYGPSGRLDIELELGFVVGKPSSLGEPVPTVLSPTTSSASSSSTTGARATSRRGSTAARPVPRQELRHVDLRLGDAVDAAGRPPGRGAAAGSGTAAPPARRPRLGPRHPARGRAERRHVAHGNARTLYWTMPQQLAHAASNGASVRTGDLMASGTISGAERGSEGS